jgi:hypothetical protein
VASFKAGAPFSTIDAVDLPAGSVVMYTDGIALAFVLSDPTVWIIQSPLDPDGLDGLDAGNAAYADAATFGTEVSNIVLSSGVKALRIAGGESTTLLFARSGSLVQISAPAKATDESFLRELASNLSSTQ